MLSMGVDAKEIYKKCCYIADLNIGGGNAAITIASIIKNGDIPTIATSASILAIFSADAALRKYGRGGVWEKLLENKFLGQINSVMDKYSEKLGYYFSPSSEKVRAWLQRHK